MEEQYTVYNLKPKDKEEQELFWKFRLDDVLDLFRYICYCETIWFLGTILLLIDNYSTKTQIAVLLGLI